MWLARVEYYKLLQSDISVFYARTKVACVKQNNDL